VISREGDKIKVVVVPKEKDKNKTEDLSSAFVKAEAPQSPVEKVEESEVDAADIDQQWQVMPASKSPEELDAQFNDYYRGLDFPVDPFINNNVTREQERASYGMIAYQAEDYYLINGLLRNRITVEEEVYGELDTVIDPVEYKATVKQIYSMDMLYENAPTIPEDMVLYRGINSEYSDRLMRSYEVGDLFQDPAYSSTTTSLESAEIWASSHNADYVPSVPGEKAPGLVLEIIAPAGTRGIYLPAYLGGQVDHGDELEVLLDRGTTFRVITKIEDADGNTRVMRVAVVDQTKKPIDPNEPWSAPKEKITEPDAPEVDNSPETVNRLGSEVSNPAEADAVVIDRTPPDEVLVELLREGGSQTVGSKFNENWATYIEELPQKKFEETYTFPKTGKTVSSLKKRYKDLAEFLTEFAQNSTFDTGLPVAKYNIPGSSFRTLPGVEVDVDEDGDARFTVKDGIGVLFAQAVAAYSSGAAYTGTRNNEEGIAAMIERFRGQRTSENLSGISPGSLMGVHEIHESLYDFWRSYAAIMNDPSLLDVDYGTQNEHSKSLAGILLNTLSFAGKLDGTFVRTLTFEDVDIDTPEHPLRALTSVGQEIAMRPSSWAKFGQGGGTSDDDGLFTATGFGYPGSLGDVALFITDPEGLAIGDFTAMAENEALLKNGRYRVVSVEKVTATRKAWDLDVEDWVVGEHTYTKITLEQSKSEPSDTPKEALAPVKNPEKYQYDLGKIYDNALGDDVDDVNAAAMRLYQEDQNTWVATNYRLRGTKPASRIEEEHNVELSDLDTIIKAFDEEIDKVPGLPVDTLLYRGTRNRSAEKLFSLAVGEEFTDLGFVSTSLEYDTAEMFSRDVDVLSGVILEIEAPAGTKGISLAAYFGDTVDTETEVVLARGTTFVVKSKTDSIDGNSRKMRIAIIDQTTSVEQEPVKADEDNVTYNDIENWTKVGPKKGSNEGGTFRDQSGNDYYVKEPRSTLHAQNEALAAALYKELQVPAVEVFLGEKNGELRTVSPIVESTGVLGYNPERSVIEKLQEGFAVDAWLANWDIAGLTFDNVIIDKDGNPIRVDPGGTLMWRAQGEPKGKMFGDVVGEIDTLRSESKAPEASVIFGDMTDDQVKESAKVLLNISPERIDEIVDSIISDFADAADLKMKLRNRRQSILDRFGLTDADKLDEPVEETPTEEQVLDNSTEMVTTLGADVSMPNVLVEGRGAAPDHTPRDKELVARLVAEGPQAMGSQFVENWAKLYEEYDGSDTEAKDAAMFMWEMNINSIENRAKTDELVQNAVIGIFASTMSYVKDTLPPAPFSGTGRPQLRRDLAEWREDFPTDLVQKDRLSEKAFWTDLARYFDTPELIDIEMTPASAFLRILRAWEGSGNPPQEYDRFLSFYDKKITDDDHPLKYMLTPGQEVVLRPSSWTNADELTNFDEFLSAAIKGSPSDYEDYEQVGDQFSPLEVGHVVLRVAVDSAYAIDQLSHVKSEKESIIPNGRYRVKSVERVNESLDFDDNEFVPYTRITLEVVPLEKSKKAAPSEALAEAAGELGVNIDAYYDEALDIDDVEQATNKFSLAKTEHMTASDAVIVKRSDEGDLIAMIEREFGPFRGAYALPGGMLDAGETFAQAADREMQEEVGFDAANAMSRTNLGSVTDSPDWDPRFVNGVSVGAVSYIVPDDTELIAQDDARAALWIPVEDLANGIYPIAFGHAAWLAEHYKGGILGDKFEVIVEASKERNARLIEKINKVREDLGEPVFAQYGKDAPWWSPVAAVEEITEDLDSPLQLDYKEWRNGSTTYVDEAGVTVGVSVDYDDVYALKNGSLEPPALPFFVPIYSSPEADSGEGYYFAKSGKRYWGRYGAAGVLLRRVKEDGTLEYLLAKRSANISAGGGQWAWPGGAHKDKKHAQSPQLTAYEELKEELGVYPEGIDPIATHTNFVEPDWQYETMIVDVTNNSSLTDSLKISDDENSDLGWFTEDDIRELKENNMLHPAVASSIEQVLAISRVYDSPLELPVYEPKEQPEMVGAQKITQTGRPKVTPENPLPLSASAIDGTYSVMDAIHHVKNSDDIAVSTFVDGGDIEDLEVRASIVVDEPTGEKKLSLRFKLTAWAADRLLDPIRFVRNNNKEDVINPAKRKALKLSGDLSEAEITEKPVMPAQFYVDPASGTVVRTGGPAKIVKVSAAQADTNRPVIYEGSILVIDDSKGKTGAVYEIVDEDGEEFFVPDYNIPIQERPYAHDESAVSYDNTVRIYLPLDATEDQVAAALRAAGVQDVRAGTNEDLKVIAENRLLSIFKQHTDPAKNVEDQLTRDELLDSIKKTENVTVDDIEFRISDTGRVEMMFSEEKAKELAQRLEIDRFEHEVPNMRAGMMYYVDNPNIMFGGISAVPREYTATAAAKSILRTMSANRLNSTMTRLLEGNQDTGLSSDSDIKKGSADYVFTTPMNVKTSLSDFTNEESAHDLSNTIFVFSAEKLLRRLDIYGNREDKFGQRFDSHNIYAEIDLSTYRSAYEAMFKHDVDFGEYLTYISVAEDIRNEILDMLSQSGITTMYGIPVEELFVVHGDVPNREKIAKQIAENADLVEDIEQKQLGMGANPIEFRAFTNVVAKVWDFESDTGTTWFMPAPDGSKILGLVRPGSENPTMDIYVQEPSGGLYLYSGSDAESLTAYDMTTEYMRRAVSKSGLTHTLSVLNSNDSGIEKFFTYMYGTEDKNVFTGFYKLGISKYDLPQYVPAGVVNHYLSEDTWRESLNNLIEWYYDDNGTRRTTDIPMSTVLASWAVSNMPIEAREALETMIDTLADGIRPVVSAGTPTSAAPSYVSSLEYFIETGNIIGGIAGLETTYNSGEKTITLIYTVKRRVLEKEDGKIAIVLAVATDNGTRLFELKEPTDLIFNKKTGIGTFSTASAQYRIQPLESVYAEHDNETKKNRQAK
jgi:ADP-ribose pyrophosphatase YjhB (NUDIX family)